MKFIEHGDVDVSWTKGQDTPKRHCPECRGVLPVPTRQFWVRSGAYLSLLYISNKYIRRCVEGAPPAVDNTWPNGRLLSRSWLDG